MNFSDRKRPPQDDNLDAWLLTYADMITLFLCFFAMLIALSVPKEEGLEKVKKDISGQFVGHEGYQHVRKDMVIELNSLKYLNQFHGSMKLEEINKGVVLEFSSTSIYSPGSSEINESAKGLLQQIAATMQRIENEDYAIEIEGHTDNIPIKTPLYPSNWELSTSRATNVVRFFIGEGIEPKRLKAAGYADIFPKVPNFTPEGKPIPANQAMNRRIVIKLLQTQ